MRVGIVGTGAFARTHARAAIAHPQYELLGFSGAHPTSADSIADEFDSTAYPSTEALLTERPDGVILATPHATHAPLASQALDAGIPVLVEKPLALSTMECDALIAIEETSSVRGMVGHLMRWAPAHRQAKALIEAGVIGQVITAHSQRVIPWNANLRRPWHKSQAAGGGMWLIQGVHVIDQLTWLLGGRASSAVGVSETRSHPEQDADDFGVALVQFGTVPVTITIAGTRSAASDVVTQVVGTEGSLRVSHRGLLEVDLGSGPQDRLEPATTDPWEATLAGELTEFSRVVAGDPTDVDFGYGRYVVATVEAIRRSALSKRWEHI